MRTNPGANDGASPLTRPAGDGVPELITLRKTHFLYTSLVLGVLLIILAIVLSPGAHAYWCQHFDMPDYERQFGFKLGSFELPDQRGGAYTVTGVASVDPDGW